MVDELDPRLEATLRTVLRQEADAVPFTLRAADFERTRSERARARRAQRWTVIAAAAVVIAVGGLALATTFRPSGPASVPGDRLAGLPTFERLAESTTGGGSTIQRLEDVAGTQSRQWQFGLPTGAYAFEYLVACRGSNPMTVSLAAESVSAIKLGTVTCDGGVWRLAWDGTDERAILAAASVSIEIEAQPGTAWRMLVVEDGSGRIVQRFGTSSLPFRLPSMDHIVAQRTAGATELARGAGLSEAASGTALSTLRGLGNAAAIEILFACSGSEVSVSLASSDPTSPSAATWPMTCDGTLQTINWVRDNATLNVSEARVSVPAGTAWEVIAFDISAAPPPTIQPPATTSP